MAILARLITGGIDGNAGCRMGFLITDQNVIKPIVAARRDLVNSLRSECYDQAVARDRRLAGRGRALLAIGLSRYEGRWPGENQTASEDETKSEK